MGQGEGADVDLQTPRLSLPLLQLRLLMTTEGESCLNSALVAGHLRFSRVQCSSVESQPPSGPAKAARVPRILEPTLHHLDALLY